MPATNADLDEYRGRPRMDSTSGPLLGMRLIKSAPADRSARLTAALEDVRGATVNVQEVRKQRSRARPETLRPYDKQVDDGWGGLYSILRGHARLEGIEQATLAQRIIALLFAEGMEWLKASYESEWLHGETLLQRIEEESLTEGIVSLAGEHTLAYIRRAQTELADALGVGDIEIERVNTTAMAEALDALATAVAKYVRILAGETDEDDEASVARFVRAVAPIDRHREYHARPRSGATETETPPVVVDPETDVTDPDAPVPPIDPPA